MKIFSKGPFAAIFWGGLLACVFDLAQAFIVVQPDGIHSVSDPAAYRWRSLWNAFS